MDRIKSQAAVVSQLLFDPQTADTYKNVFVLTGQIIKEIFLLFWLLICSGFVLGAWFSDLAINSGRSARTWLQTQQTETQDSSQTAVATGQAILDAGQNGAYFLLNKAREQIGLDKIEPLAKADSPNANQTQATKAEPKQATPEATKAVDQVTAVPQEANTAVDDESPETQDSAESSTAEH